MYADDDEEGVNGEGICKYDEYNASFSGRVVEVFPREAWKVAQPHSDLEQIDIYVVGIYQVHFSTINTTVP